MHTEEKHYHCTQFGEKRFPTAQAPDGAHQSKPLQVLCVIRHFFTDQVLHSTKECTKDRSLTAVISVENSVHSHSDSFVASYSVKTIVYWTEALQTPHLPAKGSEQAGTSSCARATHRGKAVLVICSDGAISSAAQVHT